MPPSLLARRSVIHPESGYFRVTRIANEQELEELLSLSASPALAIQVDDLELASRCACREGFCSTFYVTGGRSPLTEEQRRDRGTHHHGSLDVDASVGLVVVDTDELDRIVGVEVLNRPDVEAELTIALERMRHGR